ncbi:MAG: VRR-NUC domain-containing protein, partial [Bordetella sp.]|nr:VRR-NUC domain-containing protein [Bordetella sp.]
ASRVEWVARDHLGADDAPVHYVENGLINSLFGLLCWEAIFHPVAGAFFHPFQRGPADLHEAGFRARRAAAFDDCLGALRDGSHRARILARFDEKQGVQSPFVFWGMLRRELLEQALACIAPAHLALWFARLLDDLKTNRSGLPDLVRFWPGEGRYELIEVKGPGDRLQDNQLRWLAYAAEHGLPVRVCHVRWAEADSMAVSP